MNFELRSDRRGLTVRVAGDDARVSPYIHAMIQASETRCRRILSEMPVQTGFAWSECGIPSSESTGETGGRQYSIQIAPAENAFRMDGVMS